MINHDITILESTQLKIEHYLIGVSNIWERELPDQEGNVAARMSANLTIYDLESETSRVEKVFAGSILTLESHRYLLVKVEDGNGAEQGSVTLRQMP